MISVQTMGGILDIALFILSCWRLHSVETDQPVFVLYLTLVLAFGYLLIGDVDYWVKWIDFGEAYIMPSVARALVSRILILVGLTYVNIRGESRHKPCRSQPKLSCRPR